ncbi:hypothetical protein KCU65_g475, partial [Aureobasidium melanogenum]
MIKPTTRLHRLANTIDGWRFDGLVEEGNACRVDTSAVFELRHELERESCFIPPGRMKRVPCSGMRDTNRPALLKPTASRLEHFVRHSEAVRASGYGRDMPRGGEFGDRANTFVMTAARPVSTLPTSTHVCHHNSRHSREQATSNIIEEVKEDYILPDI